MYRECKQTVKIRHVTPEYMTQTLNAERKKKYCNQEVREPQTLGWRGPILFIQEQKITAKGFALHHT